MKKIIFFVLVFFAMVVAVYILIPAVIKVSAAGYLQTNSRIASNYLTDNQQWRLWWPSKKGDGNQFEYNGYYFFLKNKTPYAAEIVISNKNKSIEVNSVADLVIYKLDNTGFEWSCQIHSSLQPIKRIQQYMQAVQIKKCMKELMAAYNRYVSVTKNVYEFNIEKTRFKDTFMISNQIVLTHPPLTTEIYNQIDKLKTYALSNKAYAINAPMLNMETTATGIVVKTALPINKEISSADGFQFRFMVQGNTLVANVIGGPATIDRAILQLKNYVSDNRMSSPAIPFQSLITDRTIELDSSKWITKVFLPVM